MRNILKLFRDQRTTQTVTSGSSASVNPGVEVVLVNKTSGSATDVALPTLPASAAGSTVLIKDAKLDAASNNITVSTPGSETIDGSNTYVQNANGEATTFLWDGANWHVVGSYKE